MKFKHDIEAQAGFKDKDGQLGAAGQILSSTGSQTDWITQGDIVAGNADRALSLTMTVKNSTGTTIPTGSVVCFDNSVATPSGNIIPVKLADNNGTDSMPAVGVTNGAIADDAEGIAIMFGKASGFNTSSFSTGDALYVSDTPGAFTTTKPTDVKYIQRIGIVVKVHASNGTIEVFGAGRVNDVPTPLYIDHANQRLGIGTTSPSNRLEIVGPYSATPLKILRHGDYGNIINLGRSGVSETAHIGYPADATINFSTGGTERMRIDSSGDLTVQGGRIYLKESDLGNNAVVITRDADEGYLQLFSSGSQTVELRGNGNSYINGGDVGIGTTSPSSALHIANTTPEIYLEDSNTGAGDAKFLANNGNLGLFSDVNNEFASSVMYFTVDASERMRIDSSGNVGIGTTIPGAKLEVNGAGNFSGGTVVSGIDTNTDVGVAIAKGDYLYSNDGNYLRRLIGQQSGGSIDIGQQGTGIISNINFFPGTSGNIDFFGSGSIDMRVASSGNVGIGTTSPGANLEVAGDTPVIRLTDTRNLNVGDWDDVSLGRIEFKTSDTTTPGVRVLSEIEAYSGPGAASGPESQLRFKTSTNSDTSATTKMTINAQGNVGIGTTSPTRALDVSKSGSTILANFKNTGGTSSFISLGNTSSIADQIRLGSNGTALTLSTNYAERMRIDASGNVGIGTTSPRGKMDITNGSTGQTYSNISGLLIDVNGSSNSYYGLRVGSSTGNSHLAVTNAGNVGIGTASPVSIVDISSTDPILTIGGVAVNQFESGRIRFTEAAGTSAGFQGSYIHYDGSTNKLHLGMHEVADTSISNDVNAITILRANTYVGIGTDSPSYKLSVNGNIQSDFIRGYTYPTNSFLDFDDDQTASSNHTRLASVGRIAYLADTNANEPVANAAHEFFTGTSDIDTATSLMIIETSGNVGIGTTSPSELLHIEGTLPEVLIKGTGVYDPSVITMSNGSGDSSFITNYNNPGVKGLWLKYDNGSTGDATIKVGQNELLFDVNNGAAMYINSLRNVGIGTTSPYTNFEVVGKGSFGSSGASNLGVEISSVSAIPSAQVKGYIAQATSGAGGGNGDLLIASRTSAATNIRFFAGSTSEKMRIDSSGNVGIGTTTTSGVINAKLYVNGGIHLPSNRDISGALGLSPHIGTGDFILYSGNPGSGSEKFRITNAGNVGIGTTSPQEELHIASTVPVIRLEDTDGGYAQIVGSNGSLSLRSDQANTVASSIIDFTIDNSERMRINSSGNVGIGTTSPAVKLHVGSTSTSGATTEEFRLQSGTSSGDGGTAIANLVTGNFGTSGIYFGNNTTYSSQPAYLQYRRSDNNTTLKFDVRFNIDQGSSGTRFNINSSGNVGIGTTSPAEKLAVSGSIRIPRTEEFYWTDGSVNGNPRAVIFSTDNEFGGDYNGLGFSIGANGRTAPSMYIRGTGNVGIGTTSPGKLLELKGGDNEAVLRLFNDQANTWDIQNSTLGKLDFIRGSSNTYMRIDQFGNVGIGTTSPGAKLTVVDDILCTGSSPSLTLTDATSSFVIKTNTAGEGIVQTSGTSKPIRFFRNNGSNESMRINGDGNVGIGTTSPAAKLEVEGVDHLLQLSAASSTGNPYLSFNQAGTRRSFIQHADNGDYLKLASEYGGISFFTGTGGTETQKMTILSGGNVGIGTTSPQQKLDVNGDIAIKNATQLSFDSNNGTLSVASHAGQLDLLSSSIFINYSSNVGIGTTTPSYLLEVSGSAAKSTGTTWINTSDERTKENIQNYTKGLNDIVQLQPRVFDYNGKGSTEKSKENIGLIAQEVIDVYPEAIGTFKAKLDETDAKETDIYNLDFHSISISMINAIKELNEKVKILETKIQTLENQ